MTSTDFTASPFTSALETASVAELEQELEQIREAIARLETQMRLFELAIQWKVALDPKVASNRDLAPSGSELGDTRPPLRRAILAVLADRRTPLRPAEIYAALEQRGWQPRGTSGKGQLHARLSRMVKEGELSRTGEAGAGRYALPTEETDGPGRAPPQ